MYRIYTYILPVIFICLAVAVASPVYAKLKETLTHQEVENIKEEAGNTIQALSLHLNYLADPEADESEMPRAIMGKFTPPQQIFYDNTFEVEDDTDPAANSSEGATLVNIEQYLRGFHHRVAGRSDPFVKLEVNRVSDIYTGDNSYYLRIYYSQTFNAATEGGQRFPKLVSRVATMRVVQQGSTYKTYINRLEFADKSFKDGTPVRIVDEASSVASLMQETAHSEAFYTDAFNRGREALRSDQFADAYYYLIQAHDGKAVAADADKLLTEISVVMTKRGKNYSEDLSAELAARADGLEDQYRYAEAIRYYTYAGQVKPAAATKLNAKIQSLTARQAAEGRLSALLGKGAYKEAATEYTAALRRDENNPNLYLGLAQAYGRLGQDTDALEAFGKAAKLARSNPEVYRQRGLYAKWKGDYNEAYEAFANYQSIAADKYDNILLSELAYCRGMQLLNAQKATEALDSFEAALAHNSENKEAAIICGNAALSARDFKNAEKLAKNLLRIADGYAPAYYLLAQAYQGQKRTSDAEESYKKAIEAEPQNIDYHFGLGDLQMSNGLRGIQAAVVNLSQCVQTVPTRPRERNIRWRAYWKRGQCYYLLGKNDAAAADYQIYKDSANVQDAFYLDYANLLIRQRNYDEALRSLAKAKSANLASRVMLSKGIIYYQLKDGNWEQLFVGAFEGGIDAKFVQDAPFAAEIFENCKEFRKLCQRRGIRFD